MDIPQRDSGGYSGNNHTSAEAYRDWIVAFANGIGVRGAVVVLEPATAAKCLRWWVGSTSSSTQAGTALGQRPMHSGATRLAEPWASAPTTATGNRLVDAYLWIKAPGESDGSCNGAPAAGIWMPEYALGLALRG